MTDIVEQLREPYTQDQSRRVARENKAANWARDCHRAAHMTACHWNDGGKLMPDTLYNIRAARAYLDCILTGHRFDGDSHLAATVKEIVDSEEAA